MLYITQETHALHYTGNTCTILHKKQSTISHRRHLLNITQVTHALYYIKNKALHYTGDTCSTLHRKQMHYITQETHALQNSRNTCTTLRRKHRKHMHFITQVTHALYYIKNKALYYTGDTCSTSVSYTHLTLPTKRIV